MEILDHILEILDADNLYFKFTSILHRKERKSVQLLNVILSGDISEDIMKYLGYAIIGVCAMEKMLREMQSVYIMFGLLRNFLYPENMGTSKGRRWWMVVLGFLRRGLVNWGKENVLVICCQ